MNRAELLSSIRNITNETNRQIYNSCCSKLFMEYEVTRTSEINDIPNEKLNTALKSYLIRVRENLPDEGYFYEGGKRKSRSKSRKAKSRKAKSRKAKSRKTKKSKKPRS
jgi:hypothetical protein